MSAMENSPVVKKKDIDNLLRRIANILILNDAFTDNPGELISQLYDRISTSTAVGFANGAEIRHIHISLHIRSGIEIKNRDGNDEDLQNLQDLSGLSSVSPNSLDLWKFDIQKNFCVRPEYLLLI